MKLSLKASIDRAGRWVGNHTLHDRPLTAYLAAVVIMLLALGLRLAIAPIEAGLQYITFFPAVVLVAFFGGFRPGMLATVIGIFFSAYVFTPPYWALNIEGLFSSFWSGLVFFIDGIILSFLVQASHTYRKQYQAELAESQLAWGKLEELITQRSSDYNTLLKLESIIQCTDDAVISLSLDGVIQSWNPAAEKIFGYTSKEVIGNSIVLMIPTDNIKDELDILIRIEQGKHIDQFETVLSCKNGSLIDVSATISPVLNSEGKLVGVSTIARDITKRKRAEDELKKKEHLLSESQRIGHIGSWHYELGNQQLTWTDEMYHVYGVSPDNFNLNLESFLNLIHPEDKQLMQVWLQECSAGAKPRELEFRIVMPDGTVNFISVHGELIYDNENIPNYLTGTGQNITVRKQMEISLILSREAAEHANKAKDSFLATMSHEIRTPLGGLLGMLELLSMTPLDADQTATLDTASASGRSLLRILNDILDWSKIEQGKLEIIPAPTQLDELLQEVVNTYTHVASIKSLVITKHIDARLNTAYLVDQLRLSQILNNFVSNAIKFTEHGQIEVGITLVETVASGDLVCFSVKDTGIGISPEVQKNLFQNYTQGTADTARMYGGTGLGLAICRRLADMLGGKISLLSKPGKGAAFRLTLTLPHSHLEPQLKVPHQLEVAQLISRPLHFSGVDSPEVLIVDDHPTNRELLSRQIKMMGLRVTTADSGRAGIALWRDNRFAMIITDCHMPDMDGYEMTRTIRNIETLEGLPRIPVIAWTANALKEESELIEAAGMDALLVKPVSMKILRDTLAKWLDLNADAENIIVASDSLPDINNSQHTHTPIDYSVLDVVIPSKDEQPQLLRDFLNHIRSDRSALTDMLAQKDGAALRSTAHRMKGSCNMVGAVRLSSACTGIEKIATTGDMNKVRTLVAELDIALLELERFVG